MEQSGEDNEMKREGETGEKGEERGSEIWEERDEECEVERRKRKERKIKKRQTNNLQVSPPTFPPHAFVYTDCWLY